MTPDARQKLFEKLYTHYDRDAAFTETVINEVLDEIDSRDKQIETFGGMLTNLSAETQKFAAPTISELIFKLGESISKLDEDADKAIQMIQGLRDLVKHCWLHIGYNNCGYQKMTTEQKVLYDSIIESPFSF